MLALTVGPQLLLEMGRIRPHSERTDAAGHQQPVRKDEPLVGRGARQLVLFHQVVAGNIGALFAEDGVTLRADEIGTGGGLNGGLRVQAEIRVSS